jgi:hypothetical protein
MLDYSGIKQSTLDSLKRYSEHRIPTGGFSMHLTRLTVKSLLVLSLMILINRLRNAERRVLSPFQSLYSPLEAGSEVGRMKLPLADLRQESCPRARGL